ncbi:unnamed protein product [Alopecurus aequalis]
MDFAAETSANFYMLDLVSFESEPGGSVDRGLVIPADGLCSPNNPSVPASAFQIMSVDAAVTNGNAGDITLLDRSYISPGQVVASASDLGGQIGVVTGVTTELDLIRLGDPTAPIQGASPCDLRRVRALSLGDYVVSGQWLGRVVEVSLDVDVVFDDGAVCKVTGVESRRKLVPETPTSYRPQTNTLFYPGQRVTADPYAVFKASQWLNGHWKPSREVGTVCKVEMAGVLVYWIASALSVPMSGAATTTGEEMEESWSTTDDDSHEHTMLTNKKRPDETTSYRKQTRKYLFVGHRRTRREDRSRTKLELPMSVSNTRTAVDVLWQDGTLQHGAPSSSVVPFEIMNEHEFFPGQYVIDNAPAPDGSVVAVGSNRRLGIVRSLNYKDQMVHVSWLKAASSSTCLEVACDDTVSAYDLGRDSDRSAFYGDVVIRLVPLGLTDGRQSLARGRKNGAATSDLSWVGRVVDLLDGHVQVKWGDCTISTVLPHEIIVVNDDHYSELQAEMGDWVEEDGAGDLLDRDNLPANPADSNIEGADDSAARATTWTWGLGGVIRLMNRLVGETLGQGKSYLSRWSTLPSVPELPPNENAAVPIPASVSGSGDDNLVMGTSCDATAGSHDSDPEEKPATGGGPFGFPRFDIVQSPSDHHYLETTDPECTVELNARHGMSTFHVHLHADTIYVRAFEDRMDLLRVVMVGASGTPYHDGLFFFDFQLPPSYPSIPPQVYYHSFGVRLNPNLYTSGTVCLSLLNTFGGEGAEVWSASMSTLLQVVVSIQGLVLNNQPYYNEAGYEDLVGTPEGRRNALPYNEKAYLLTLQTMLHLLRRPPLGFDDFIKDHFRRRGRFVLRACESYLQGCTVGTLTSDASPTKESSERPCSAGLRLALGNAVPSLREAIQEIGAED